MDILYVYRHDGVGGHSLRHSFRSIAEHGKNVGKVFVVGDKPDFLSSEVTYIPFADVYSRKEREKNIALAIKTAIDGSDISEEFLYSSDDHFYCKDVDFDNYPYYCKLMPFGEFLPERLETPFLSPGYSRMLMLTRAILEERRLPYLNFTLHRNMHINKTAYNECWDVISKCFETSCGIEPLAYVINYMYAHEMCKPTITKDVKLTNDKHELSSDKIDCFSATDYTLDSELCKFIENMFNDKCKYEL